MGGGYFFGKMSSIRGFFKAFVFTKLSHNVTLLHSSIFKIEFFRRRDYRPLPSLKTILRAFLWIGSTFSEFSRKIHGGETAEVYLRCGRTEKGSINP